MQQKAFCCVSFGKFEPALHNINKNDGSAQGKHGTYSIKSSTRRWNSSLSQCSSLNILVSSEAVIKDANLTGYKHKPTISLFCYKGD